MPPSIDSDNSPNSGLFFPLGIGGQTNVDGNRADSVNC
jgi:hypothetical protein